MKLRSTTKIEVHVMTRSFRCGRLAGTIVTCTALGLSACGGSPTASPPTTQGRSLEATSVYPPIPLSSSGMSEGCLGRKGTGMTTEQAQLILAEVKKIAGKDLILLSACPNGPVLVGLSPGNEAIAHQIWTRYGAGVVISVGLTIYDGTPGRSPHCGTLEPSMSYPDGLRLALHLNSKSVQSGSTFNANVVITETGSGTFFMDTGQPIQAVLVKKGGRQVVGVYSGGIGGTGYAKHLSTWESETIPVVGGTARCDGGTGSALPSGSYQVVAEVAPEELPHTPSYLTPPVALRVTPA
jgi:hypothetical protein